MHYKCNKYCAKDKLGGKKLLFCEMPGTAVFMEISPHRFSFFAPEIGGLLCFYFC